MSQPELNESKVETRLKQMSGKAVAKGVNRCRLVDAALLERGAEGVLDRAFVNRLGRLLKTDVGFSF